MGRHLEVLRKRTNGRAVLPETIALAAICLLDLGHTVALVASGLAVEANPLLAPIIEHGGWIAFAIVKATSFLVPIAVLESIRPLRPEFVRKALRYGACGYLLVYTLSSFQLNVLPRLPM